MKDCWPDGDLRAYFDGELTPDSREHLDTCPACGARYRELSERAARVSALLAGLPEGEYAAPASRKWVPAALVLAAGLAIAFLMVPKHGTVKSRPVAKIIDVTPPVTVAVATEASAPRVPAVHHAVARRPAAVSEEFLRLDDDPIETGTLVRVSAEDGALVADLIIGSDGRAHAIRVIGNQ
jgi:anti-sigma factor RsiW